MRTTKVFKSGNSQAVRLPKDLQFHSEKVQIIKHGKELIIREIPENLAAAFRLLSKLPNDFFQNGRSDSYLKKEIYFNDITLHVRSY